MTVLAVPGFSQNTGQAISRESGGLPHGFMVQGGQLWKTDKAEDADQEMVDFFRRML